MPFEKNWTRQHVRFIIVYFKERCNIKNKKADLLIFLTLSVVCVGAVFSQIVLVQQFLLHRLNGVV